MGRSDHRDLTVRWSSTQCCEQSHTIHHSVFFTVTVGVPPAQSYSRTLTQPPLRHCPAPRHAVPGDEVRPRGRHRRATKGNTCARSSVFYIYSFPVWLTSNTFPAPHPMLQAARFISFECIDDATPLFSTREIPNSQFLFALPRGRPTPVRLSPLKYESQGCRER